MGMTMARRGKWLAAEKEIIRRYYGSIGAAGCMKLLPGRGRHEIRSVASALGVSKKRPASDRERFESFVLKSDGCWTWKGSLDRYGYGQFKVNGHPIGAHRFSYLLHFGDLPMHLCVCHSCDNPSCVNPSHLWLGTHADNARDRREKGRSVCLRGERSPVAKLTPEQIRDIRASSESQRALASKFNVSQSNISRIRLGNTWRHVPTSEAGDA